MTPDVFKPNATAYAQRQAQERFRRRAAIETCIGHLRSDFRLGRNFLSGVQGDVINLLFATTAANLRLWLRHAAACLHAIIANFPVASRCVLFPHGPQLKPGF